MRSRVGVRIRAAVMSLALCLSLAPGPCWARDDADEESDSALFTVVIEHGGDGEGEGGWRCGAALVSLRTALTSARCARGPAVAEGADAPVWARAPLPGTPPPRASRVLRVALTAAAEHDAGGVAWSASVASRDLALVELEQALGGARPILLASARADCEPSDLAGSNSADNACYLVRALGSGQGARLRIVELTQRAGAACWPPPALPSAATLCLDGPELCLSDQGAGVVCGGKLCGVLSASRAGGGAAGCGAPHAAASAPRWRRFLHCAHTRGACGRDGECLRLCSERWLVEEHSQLGAAPLDALWPTSPAPPAPRVEAALASPASPAGQSGLPTRTTPIDTESDESDSLDASAVPALVTRSSPPRPAPAPAPPPPPPPPAPHKEDAPTLRHGFEFEPNRADFTMRPARPTRVALKAGEYGDNAADEYAADDLPGAAPAAGAPGPTPAEALAPGDVPALESRAAPPPPPAVEPLPPADPSAPPPAEARNSTLLARRAQSAASSLDRPTLLRICCSVCAYLVFV